MKSRIFQWMIPLIASLIGGGSVAVTGPVVSKADAPCDEFMVVSIKLDLLSERVHTLSDKVERIEDNMR